MSDSKPKPKVICNLKKLEATDTFFKFFESREIIEFEKVFDSVILLLESKSPFRNTVLEFLTNLLEECCEQYCLMNSFARNKHFFEPQYKRSVLIRFIKALNLFGEIINKNNSIERTIMKIKREMIREPKIANKIIQRKIKQETIERAVKREIIEQETQQEIIEDDPLRFNYEYYENILIRNNLQTASSIIMKKIETNLPRLSTTLINSIQPNMNNENACLYFDIYDWALILAIRISFINSHYLKIVDYIDPSLITSKCFWESCPYMQFLLQIIHKTIKTIKPTILVDKVLKYSPKSDWILLHLLATLDDDNLRNEYLAILINHPSTLATIPLLTLFAQVNTKAVADCCKSNIPFSLELCMHSKQVLNFLAKHVVENVDIQTMNQFAQSLSIDGLETKIIYCLLNSDYRSQLFKKLFELMADTSSSDQLKEKILKIHTLMAKQAEKYRYSRS